MSGVMMESSPVSQLNFLDQPHFNGYDRRIRSISLPEPAGGHCQPEIHLPKPLDEPIVAIIGVGYVGLHLVQEFSKHFKVIAFDNSAERVSKLQRELKGISTITCTCDQKTLPSATHYLIAVPTPLLPNHQIDTRHFRDAIDTVALYARPGATVVVESSVPVGMTRELMTPVMARKGLKAGMSPEVSNARLISCRSSFNDRC
jgi:threonine dehydrogenase-like Zn-dependent dehydrogenase